MSRGGGAALAAAAALALGTTGCEWGEGSTSTTQTTPATTTRSPETVDHLGDLPEGWTRFENPRGGFVLGIPRGWKAERRGTDALIRSYDRLVALSITPNRSRRAQQVPLDEFATRTAAALDGFQSPVRPSRPHPFEHRYDAVQVRATATEKSGVKERLRTVVLRRKDAVTFTAILAANAKQDSEPAEDLALRVLGKLRSRPPRPPKDASDRPGPRRHDKPGKGDEGGAP